MSAVIKPNLPDRSVSVVIIDGRASENIVKSLLKMNIQVVKTLPHPDVYPAIAYHPDIMLHHIGQNKLVYAPNTPKKLLDNLREQGMDMIEGQTRLGRKYPGTIHYNVARVGNIAFHNTRYTDAVLRLELESQGVRLIHVNQGYSKCLTCIVDENSIITSDADICKKALSAGIDVLLIEPDTAISLPPFNMGFIGGATGLIAPGKLAFSGNVKPLKNSKEIMHFLGLKKTDVVMLSDEQLLDIGSIIPICCKNNSVET